MNIFSGIKIKTKLILLLALFVTGFISFGIVAKNTLEIIKVNGPIYKNIVSGKDLIADILPPPEYIVESYLDVLHLVGE